ncbi:MAG TPA: TonB-dependent receptor [Polyangia bacterium]|nr:TonB-dependent receptor [Polyangia bacterium]
MRAGWAAGALALMVWAGGAGAQEAALVGGAPPATPEPAAAAPAPGAFTLQPELWRSVPSARGFDEEVELAPGARRDPMGVGFAGAPSFENLYLIDGINVTSIVMNQSTLRAAGSGLNLDFIERIEVDTAGWDAATGRSTGGVVRAITKSGSNHFHGDAALYYDPGALRGRALRPDVPGQSLSSQAAREAADYRLDVFTDLGGPLIKDKLWFYVGLEPIFTRTSQDRIVSALVDADGNGYQDVVGGRYATRELSRSTLADTASELQWLAKLDWAPAPAHRLELSSFGSPTSATDNRILGAPLRTTTVGGAEDEQARWVSEWFGRAWRLEAAVSWHHERNEHEPGDPVERTASARWNTDPVASTTGLDPRQGTGPSLSWFRMYEPNPDALAACDVVGFNPDVSRPADPTSRLHLMCPVPGYTVGGPFGWENDSADRLGARLISTNRLGRHELQAGWDLEQASLRDTRLNPALGALTVEQSGSRKLVRRQGFGYQLDRFYGFDAYNIVPYPFQRHMVEPVQMPVPDFSQCDRAEDIPKDAAVFCASTHTTNHALFVRDLWQPLPNLSLDVGVRWDRQALAGVADDIDAVLGDTPIVLDNWSPRASVVVDPTRRGRARVYGSYARLYESIPLDLNNRTLGNEGIANVTFRLRDDPMHPTCRIDLRSCPFLSTAFSGGSKELPLPDLSGMFTDVLALGGEVDLARGFTLGAHYQHRSLDQIVEDASVDGFSLYVMNPGTPISPAQTAALRDQAAHAQALVQEAMRTGDMLRADEYTVLARSLEQFADSAPALSKLPPPRRDYDAVTLSVRKRLTRRLLGVASYTYARTIGNYPGLYDPYLDQRDPNLSQLYDDPSQLPNRTGPLPADVPHQLKLDGAYRYPLRAGGALIAGTSLRIRSGSPRNVIGFNEYGSATEFLLPAGAGGRNDVVTSFDVQLAYLRVLPHNLQLQVFLDAYNLLGSDAATARDDLYTRDATFPIVNGRMAELAHLKTTDGAVARPSAAFGHPLTYQAPLLTRLGARLSF